MGYQRILKFARGMRKNPTPAEEYFWYKVRRRQLQGKKFRRQYIIQHDEIMGKKYFFIADFYCHEQRLIVEIDGDIHNQQQDYDEMREDILKEMGYQIIRYRNEEVLGNWPHVESSLAKLLGE